MMDFIFTMDADDQPPAQQAIYTKICPAESILTAHFNAQGEQKTKNIFHPWRYFIAAGKSLEMLERYIKESNDASTVYQKLADAVGAKKYNGTFFEFDCTSADLEDSEVQLMMRFKKDPAFTTPRLSAWGDFYPDEKTARGKEIADKCRELECLKLPEKRFAKWLGNLDVEINKDGHPRFGNGAEKRSAEIEKIGNQWIIKVPVIGRGVYGADGKGGVLSGYKESWTVPPDSLPIRVSDYFRMLEDAEALSFIPQRSVPKKDRAKNTGITLK